MTQKSLMTDCLMNQLVHVDHTLIFMPHNYKLQSLVDISADEGWLATTLRVMHLVQMCVQGRWISDPSILILPHFNDSHLTSLKMELQKSSLVRSSNVREFFSLPEFLTLYQLNEEFMNSVIHGVFGSQQHAKQVRIMLFHLNSTPHHIQHTLVNTHVSMIMCMHNNYYSKAIQSPTKFLFQVNFLM